MAYIDGYVLAVPSANKDKYREIATKSAKVFKDHGALHVVEAWGDDVPQGKVTSFPMAVKCAENEKVVFSWVMWPSRSARDVGMPKVMADPRMKFDSSAMPFDGQRMIFGGFEPIVDE
jgi:uncharacterized protein YbaA (DUF1428 family)